MYLICLLKMKICLPGTYIAIILSMHSFVESIKNTSSETVLKETLWSSYAFQGTQIHDVFGFSTY